MLLYLLLFFVYLVSHSGMRMYARVCVCIFTGRSVGPGVQIAVWME